MEALLPEILRTHEKAPQGHCEVTTLLSHMVCTGCLALVWGHP